MAMCWFVHFPYFLHLQIFPVTMTAPWEVSGGVVGPALLRPAAAFQQTRPTSLECSPTEQMRLCFFALPMSALLKLVFEEGTFKNVTAGTQLKPSR